MNSKEILKKYFGYDNFRDGQERLINSILSGTDTLGIMPTGAGKSICFQVPALIFDGITIIISPLISLMKDQVNALAQIGAPAAFINSSLSDAQIRKVIQRANNNEFKLIYVAPERLESESFLNFAKTAKISMLSVDEAHCISQWGQDFRPSYSNIPNFIKSLKKRPIISAFTATATPKVKEDIVTLLELSNPTILVNGFDRKNLYFEVQKPKDKFDYLLSFLKDKRDKSGVIYCSTRNDVEEVCEKLQKKGYNSSRYHAGLSDVERHTNQDDFLFDRVQIMCATNAFGMGIDKSNVSFVVHYNMPKDIESYYQEAGRAGRDGSDAQCILLYSGQDVRTNMWLIENSKENEYLDIETEEILKERERKRLREMTFYCATTDCLRGYILKYFGEQPDNFCGNCGSCNSNFEEWDVTIESQKILSCVYRLKERFGIKMIVDVLRGSKNQKLLQFGFDKLSTYNISKMSEKQLRDIINHLILNNYLVKTDSEFPVIMLGKRADEILKDGENISMKLVKEIEIEDEIDIDEGESRGVNARKGKKNSKTSNLEDVDQDLFVALKKLRLQIASEQRVAAFIVFSDNTLKDMCAKMPKTKDEFMQVSGVGQVKCDKYGEQFLKLIKSYI